MKHLLLGSTAVVALAMPAGASEFDFRGVEIVGTGYMFEAPDIPEIAGGGRWSTLSLGASAEIGLGGNFFAQKDAVFQAYDMPWGDYKLASLGGHLGYEIGNGTNIGAFGYGELWDQNDEGDMNLGVEIAGHSDRFVYEGYGAYVFDPLKGTGWKQYHLEATGGYEFGNGLGVEVGFHYMTGDLRFPGDMWQALANVSYDLAPDFAVELGYVYSDTETDMWDAHGVKLALTKVFGGGTTFSQRNYLSLHNGY